MPIRSLSPALLLVFAACHAPPPLLVPPEDPAPQEFLGRFQDDYGNHYQISAGEWLQLPHGRFHIVQWLPEQQYLLARNDSANAHAPGKWTRIDWMPFEGMAPYTWGFCLTAYDAPTLEAARAAVPPDRATPRTGCNGYPFSRMRPDTTAVGSGEDGG